MVESSFSIQELLALKKYESSIHIESVNFICSFYLRIEKVNMDICSYYQLQVTILTSIILIIRWYKLEDCIVMIQVSCMHGTYLCLVKPISMKSDWSILSTLETG